MRPNLRFTEEYGAIDDPESTVYASQFLFITSATSLELRTYDYRISVQENLQQYPYLQDCLLTEDGHK